MDKYLTKNRKRKTSLTDTLDKKAKSDGCVGENGRHGSLCSDSSLSKASIDLSQVGNVKFSKIKSENLDCDYVVIFRKSLADQILQECERELQYNTGDLAKVKLFGQWRDIPRRQVGT